MLHVLRLTLILVALTVADSAFGQGDHFDSLIAPIFSAHCLDCHAGDEPKAELDLTTSAQKHDWGLIWQKIDADEMPPEEPLPDSKKQSIRSWIQAGAKWGTDPIDPFRYSSVKRAGYDWWSLQPLATDRPTEFRIGDDPAATNPIDQYITERLAKESLQPSKRADPRVLVRRLYFDLLGLPAAPEVIDRFVASPTSQAWHDLVNQLLDSPHYGERWARHWLDIVRFGETNGFEYNEQREDAWHYRDWVIRAFSTDMPYDQFARMQLAGDIISDDPIEGAAAVGFLVAGVHNTVLGKSEAMKQTGRHEELEDIAGTTAQTFLGLTVNCARCHDHKFDPISTKEYYQFIAALDGVGFGTRQVKKPTQTAQENKLVERRKILAAKLDQLFAERSNTINASSNVVTLRASINANGKNQTYAVSFAVAPTTWADTTQATTSQDAVEVRIVRSDQSVLAAHTVHPRVWDVKADDHRFEQVAFSYTGDGSGPVKIVLRPKQATTRFAGAVDDFSIADSNNKVIFETDFNSIDNLHPPGIQTTTKKRVFFGSSSNTWEHTGGNAIHVVEVGDGNLALQLYSGEAGRPDVIAETADEKTAQQELHSIDQRLKTLTSISMHTVQSGNPGIMHVRHRGDVTQVGDAVAPAGLRAIVGVPASFDLSADAADGDRRRKLANWITARDNGPFHRVIVNRIWFHHFGSAIVSTPNDFGFNSRQPSHPELLDWLAVWFRENEYSMKQLHRLIVTSNTYQQSSLPTDNPTQQAAQKMDQGNRLLWRYRLRRADAEYVRDSMLDVSGMLNRRLFGPGFKDVRTDAVGAARYYVAIDPIGDEFNRRTIYRWQARGQRSSLLETFDCPDPSTTSPKRNITTTPNQALSQWNHPLVIRSAAALATRVERKSGADANMEAKLDQLWRLVLGRLPSKDEKSSALVTADKHGLPLVCRVLLNSNESIIIE